MQSLRPHLKVVRETHEPACTVLCEHKRAPTHTDRQPSHFSCLGARDANFESIPVSHVNDQLQINYEIKTAYFSLKADFKQLMCAVFAPNPKDLDT